MPIPKKMFVTSKILVLHKWFIIETIKIY